MKDDTLLTLGAYFALLSLFTIGGGMAALPEMHRLAVESKEWMTTREFTDLFAIAQVSPGPNILLVTLIGYHVAGLSGAFVATAAICGPTCIVAYFVGGAWHRFRAARWRTFVQAGLVPVSVGLMAAGCLIVTMGTLQNWQAGVIIAVTAGVTMFTTVHPLWLFALGGALGLWGLV